MPDLSETIANLTARPKKMSSDAGSVEEHSIDDLVKANEHLAGKDAAKNKNRGLRFTQIIPPGAV